MHQVIDDRSLRNDQLINGLFVPKSELGIKSVIAEVTPTGVANSGAHSGKIQTLKEGFGFIMPSTGGSNLFFYHTHVLNADFAELKTGDSVEYEIGSNDKGSCATTEHSLRE
jgi:cold shock CspA family protein